MSLEVSARMKVREGQLEGFKKQATEVIRLTREKDTRTLRYDWFLSTDGRDCEIRETYVDSDGLIEHRANVGDALNRLFTEFANDHSVTVYGDPTEELVEYASAQMPPGSVKWYQFLDGLGAVASDTRLSITRSEGRSPSAPDNGGAVGSGNAWERSRAGVTALSAGHRGRFRF
jgi:quinol monooxygenase YgiN